MDFFKTVRAFERTWLRPFFHFLPNQLNPPESMNVEDLERLLEWGRANAARPPAPGADLRLAMLSPVPPASTGIANFAETFFRSGDWRLDLYAPGDLTTRAHHAGPPEPCLLPLRGFGGLVPLETYDAVLLQVGNSSHHAETLGTWVRKAPDRGPRRIIHLHEAQLVRLWAPWCKGNPWQLSRLYNSYYPDRSFGVMNLFMPQDEHSRVPRGIRPLIDLARPDLIVVNSAFCADLVRRDLEGWDQAAPPIHQLFHPVPGGLAPEALEIRQSGRRIGHFGTLGDGKDVQATLGALRKLQERCPTTLVLAGFNVGRYARRHGLDQLPWVEVHDSPPTEVLLGLMASVDAGIQLRHPTQGESSGVVNQMLGLGKPMVVTRSGSFAELGDAVIAVPPGAGADAVAEAAEHALAAPPTDAIRAYAADHDTTAFQRALLHLLDTTRRAR